MSEVPIFGLGKVGYSLAACLGVAGNTVVGCDPVADIVDAINARRHVTAEPASPSVSRSSTKAVSAPRPRPKMPCSIRTPASSSCRRRATCSAVSRCDTCCASARRSARRCAARRTSTSCPSPVPCCRAPANTPSFRHSKRLRPPDRRRPGLLLQSVVHRARRSRQRDGDAGLRADRRGRQNRATASKRCTSR